MELNDPGFNFWIYMFVTLGILYNFSPGWLEVRSNKTYLKEQLGS
jgi:hypothetical protein